MATANHEVIICECGHGHDEHGMLKGESGACVKCSCRQFRQAAKTNLKEGEQRRRLTED